MPLVDRMHPERTSRYCGTGSLRPCGILGVCVDQRKTVTAVSNGARLARHGTWLSETDLRHFADHGWVVVPDAIPPSLCLRLRSKMDIALSRVQPWQSENGLQGISEPHLTSTTFLDLFRIEGFVATCRQLVGHGPRLRHCSALRTATHPRASDPDARLTDQSTWDWHRDFQPDSIIRQSKAGSHLTSQAVVAAAYLTKTTAELGATAFLDGTHVLAGSYRDLTGVAPFVQPEVEAGSVVLFSEALMHAATPVTANGARYAVLTWMTAPWFGGEAPAPFGVDRWVDSGLRQIFTAPRFGDSEP